MFPYLHFAQFQSTDHHQRQREMDDVVKECRVFPGSLFGSYEEVYSIQKTTTSNDTRLPSNRHAGYIVIGFKLLDDSSKIQRKGAQKRHATDLELSPTPAFDLVITWLVDGERIFAFSSQDDA
ncbi:hypothetical protein OSTOST_08837 [Ostertagia ostertagi]